MILVRDVFQAKYGKSDDLVAHFKALNTMLPAPRHREILTDASGQFFAVVTHLQAKDLGEWQKMQKQVFAHPGFGK
ncbi:MAG: hypothetical protein EXR48_00370 [Dehalococcoidia bacterium]|nr:hypothetical protein [Dehalococcoidia bacterium]